MMWEYISFLPFVFPVGFIFYKKGKNKFLFISSVVGYVMVTKVILLIIASPVTIFFMFILPSLSEIGYAGYLYPLINIVDFIERYFFIFTELLFFVLPFLIHKRYEFFQSDT
jgi:hypothetical protein